MKYLIVGLGNPGKEYENTRHNIGFKVVDRIAASKDAVFATGRLGDVARVRVKNKMLTLLKPSTYMNLSGRAVAYWMEKEGVSLDNVLVVVDDIAFDFGVIRMRAKGSDGGHNGLKDIAAVCGSEAYARLRLGVGGEFSRGTQVDYVLGEWNEQEVGGLDDLLSRAQRAVEDFALMGVARAMNIVNTKVKKDQEGK